jgi:hypothetical protein
MAHLRTGRLYELKRFFVEAQRLALSALSDSSLELVISSRDRQHRVAMGRQDRRSAGNAVGAFSPDGSRVVTASMDNTARISQLDSIILMQSGERRDYVCRERLIGAQSFMDRTPSFVGATGHSASIII